MQICTCVEPTCRKKFETESTRPVDRCPICRVKHNKEISRQWHCQNDPKYTYKQRKAKRRTALANLPVIGDRYAFYWELERLA